MYICVLWSSDVEGAEHVSLSCGRVMWKGQGVCLCLVVIWFVAFCFFDRPHLYPPPGTTAGASVPVQF